ncbi:MAG: hypothetical protein R3C15_16960 [Thermoleophilia bacterium]
MVSAIQDVTIAQGSTRATRHRRRRRRGRAEHRRDRAQPRLPRAALPRAAGALSACGAQFSDVVAEFSAGMFTTTDAFDRDLVAATLARLDGQLAEVEAALATRGIERFERRYVAEGRYAYQSWQIDVPLDRAGILRPDGAEQLARAFDREHERVFAVAEPGQVVELTQCRARVVAHLARPTLAWGEREEATGPPATQRAYFRGLGHVDAPVRPGSSIGADEVVVGPALIVEPTTTLVLYPGSSARAGAHGAYEVEIELEVSS